MSSIKPELWLVLKRVVRFGDTDAAGVMHFYQLLRWCHEAWEESLEKYGLPAAEIFPSNSKEFENPDLLLPIVHCEADFRLPLKTGDQLDIQLVPKRIDIGSFQVETKFFRGQEEVAIGSIRHVAINAHTLKRCPLPEGIELWLEASSLNLGLRSL